MQSSLFKFMRRIEEEKDQNKKRGRNEAVHKESGHEKRQKMEDAEVTLKEATTSKLNMFVHTSGLSPRLGASAAALCPNDSTSSTDLSKSRHDLIAARKETKESCPKVMGESSGGSSRETRYAKLSSKSKSSEQVQYTPLEQQYLSVKATHPDAVLFVQCGYKYQLFGEDAEIASRVLKIGCFHAHNFRTGYIPVFRLNIHLRRLVAAGYKVGVVKQMETAALKAAGDNKSGPFVRKLAGLYTRSTLIGPDVEEEEGEGSTEGGSFLMCIGVLSSTKPVKRNENSITLAFMAVQPSAGNMIYDEFQDCLDSFSELETRLTQIQPVEILYSEDCSPRLKQTLMDWKNYSGSDSDVLRCEELPQTWYEYNRAFTIVTEFYGREQSNTARESESLEKSGTVEVLQVAVNLPALVISCLGCLLEYLKPFNLQNVLSLISNLKPFSSGAHCMRLGGRTLNSLEIFRNLSDGTEKDSLFWILNHTQTPFGRRLLSSWLSYPLKCTRQIKQRQDAVSELSLGESSSLALLKALLHKLPDLEKKLCSIYHRKSSLADFYNLICMLNRISKKLDSFSDMALSELKSEILLDIIREVPVLLSGVEAFSDILCETAARAADYENMFTRPELYPDVLREKAAIADIKRKLQAHRKLFRATLSDCRLDYVTVSGDQYLVEVKKKDLCRVPTDWYRVSSTKQVTRFRPPYVSKSFKELTQHQEQLVVCAKATWTSVLTDFSANYGRYKKTVDKLATADCLISLSEVAKMPGYVLPEVVEEQVVDIRGGRHPVIDLLLDGGQYVANHTKLLGDGVRCMIITGPNMGGKSSYIKQVALICIMAQVGSYVPAEAARLGVLDGVYTRMGAYDRILSGRSTFMVELQEAAEIMKLSTEKSLVILDELGRGTSTHDGTAIAYASLRHFVEHIKCLVLFVTHYPLITELESEWPTHVANQHMSYVSVEDAEEDFERIVFLYHLERGQAGASYGLNVAALAGLPSSILQLAHKKSKKLEEEVTRKLSSGFNVVQTLKYVLYHQHLSSNLIISEQ